jgi:hypothetical protein
LFIFERQRLSAVREKGDQLPQTRLPIDCARETLRAFIGEPWLHYMTVGQNEAVAGVEAGANKWVLGDLTVAFGR